MEYIHANGMRHGVPSSMNMLAIQLQHGYRLSTSSCQKLSRTVVLQLCVNLLMRGPPKPPISSVFSNANAKLNWMTFISWRRIVL